MTIEKLGEVGTVTLYRYRATCARCGHKWVSVGQEPPLRCAKCKAVKFSEPARQYKKPKRKPKK